MGVNPGDFILEDGDIYGNGVTVAVRLLEFAEPGGVCISGDGYRQVKGELGLSFAYLGERDRGLTRPAAW